MSAAPLKGSARVHVLTRQLGLHGLGAVTRRKEIQSPLKALCSFCALVVDERRVCKHTGETCTRTLSGGAADSTNMRAGEEKGRVRLHSFLSDVMEDRVETFILPSFRESRGSAWLRKRL